MIIGTLIILYYTYNYYGSLPAAKQTALTTSMRVIMLVTAATVVWFNISEIVLEFPALVTPWFQVLIITFKTGLGIRASAACKPSVKC